MEILEVGARVFGFSDKHARRLNEILSSPDFSESPASVAMFGYEVNMMGAMWQLASGLVKDLTDPLKSIVNK